MRRLAVLIIFILSIGCAMPVAAQKTFKIDELPTLPIDTIDTYHPEAKIITYTNNTFDYYFPNYDILVDKKVFKENWTINQVFAYYGVGKGTLPNKIELELIKDEKDFHIPTYGRISSRYGPRRRGVHKGIDICVPVGEPVYAVFEGRVRHAKYNNGGYGNLIIVRHPNGLETYYAHLCQLNVEVNDYVVAGQVIGYGGNTGRSSGPHLHFEIRYYDQSIDPERLIDFSNGKLKWKTFVLEKKHFNAKLKPTDVHLTPGDSTTEEEAMEEITEEGEEIIDPEEESCNEVGAEGVADENTDQSAEEKSDVSAVITEKDLDVKADNKAPVTPTKNAKTDEVEEVKAETKAEVVEEKPEYHTVKRGDTLYGIARTYKTTVDELCRLNQMKKTDTIYVDMKLRVK